jgi:hypothetical protein
VTPGDHAYVRPCPSSQRHLASAATRGQKPLAWTYAPQPTVSPTGAKCADRRRKDARRASSERRRLNKYKMGSLPLMSLTAEALVDLARVRHKRSAATHQVPSAPGLYAFYGDEQAWSELDLAPAFDGQPLYVGKAEVRKRCG